MVVKVFPRWVDRDEVARLPGKFVLIEEAEDESADGGFIGRPVIGYQSFKGCIEWFEVDSWCGLGRLGVGLGRRREDWGWLRRRGGCVLRSCRGWRAIGETRGIDVCISHVDRMRDGGASDGLRDRHIDTQWTLKGSPKP